MNNKPRRWTEAEIAKVIDLRLKGWSVWKIGNKLGRNGSSVGGLLRKKAIEDRILAAQNL